MQVPGVLVKKAKSKRTVLKAEANHAEAQIYRHYKGGIYELLYEATQESDLTPVVVYRAENGKIWTRPKDAFFEEIEFDGVKLPRFSRLT